MPTGSDFRAALLLFAFPPPLSEIDCEEDDGLPAIINFRLINFSVARSMAFRQPLNLYFRMSAKAGGGFMCCFAVSQCMSTVFIFIMMIFFYTFSGQSRILLQRCAGIFMVKDLKLSLSW